VVSDLLGTSARRMLQAVADGETDPGMRAALVNQRLRATAPQLCDAFTAAATRNPRVTRASSSSCDAPPRMRAKSIAGHDACTRGGVVTLAALVGPSTGIAEDWCLDCGRSRFTSNTRTEARTTMSSPEACRRRSCRRFLRTVAGLTGMGLWFRTTAIPFLNDTDNFVPTSRPPATLESWSRRCVGREPTAPVHTFAAQRCP
jgi:hypothetical protein